MTPIKIKRRVKSEPKKQAFLFIVALIVILIGFLLAINFVLAKKESYSSIAHAQGDSLLFTLKMDKTKYGIGEPIGLQMEIRNVGYKPITLVFDESLEYDFLIQKEKNFLFMKIPFDVWRFSGTKGSSPQKHTITLHPQEVRTYTAQWNQQDHSGKQVQLGAYIIKGFINFSGKSTELQLRGGMGGK